MKRTSCRAIVFIDGKIVLMYREKNGLKYYSLPGGGIDEGETEEACVVREVREEFGIEVSPIRKVYYYENETTKQPVYLCKYVGGEFGSGDGEEYERFNANNIYIPKLVNLNKLDVPLFPPELSERLIDDYKKFGFELNKTFKEIIVK